MLFDAVIGIIAGGMDATQKIAQLIDLLLRDTGHGFDSFFCKRGYPLLQKINHHSFADPRVELIIADAFTWMQACDRKFDAIYIDFPAPGNYDLAKLYSLEFYSLVRHCVSENGFVASDMPSGEGRMWEVYFSTLYAAGFETIKPYRVKVDSESAGILMLQEQFTAQAVAQQQNEYGYPSSTNDPQFLIKIFKKLVRESLENVDTTFVFLQPNKNRCHVQQILSSVYKKITKALTEGEAIKIIK